MSMYNTAETIGAIFGSITSVIVMIAVIALFIIAWWKICEKAGYEGWKAIIPFYSQYCLYEIAFGQGKGWLFLLLFVPCVSFVIQIILAVKLAQAFGKGTGFTIGLILVPNIFYLILGFGDAQYMGAR